MSSVHNVKHNISASHNVGVKILLIGRERRLTKENKDGKRVKFGGTTIVLGIVVYPPI